MSRTLTRPMFRKGGMAQREEYMGGGIKTIRPKYMGGGMTGIMSGIRPDAGLTPRVGYANGHSLQEIIAGKELQQPGKTIFTEDYIKNEYDKYLDKIYKGDISDVDIAYGKQVLPPVTTKDAGILEFAKTQPDTSYKAFKKGQLPGSKIDYASKQAKQKKEATEAGIDLGLGDASDDNELNETEYAEKVSEKYKLKHNKLEVKYDDIKLSFLRKLIKHFGQPFADSSIVPTYNISKKIAENVTVALSGDGSDELFRGYKKYDNKEKSIKVIFKSI